MPRRLVLFIAFLWHAVGQEQVCETLADGTTTCKDPNDLASKYGEPQTIGEGVQEKLLEIDRYMQETVFKEPRYHAVKNTCLNQNGACTFWATIGECEKNPAYMLLQCSPACQSCHKLIFEERCPLDPFAPVAWTPNNGLNKMFERIIDSGDYSQYNPQVLCRPGTPNEHVGDCPWVITLDNFLNETECQRVIELGDILGRHVSEDVGKRNADGTYGSVQSERRTSTNAWCNEGCMDDPIVEAIAERLENLTGIPNNNSEHLQLLEYQVGQFYESHHDFIPHHAKRAQGPRILTVFIYLNDVEEGGATYFNDLDLTVQPKQGRVLLWPSVLDSNPVLQDHRTHHEAQPVIKGIKYGAVCLSMLEYDCLNWVDSPFLSLERLVPLARL